MAITKTNSATGRKGSLTIDSNVIPITKWTCKFQIEYAKSTDSGNFDSGTGALWTTQEPGESNAEGTIEGQFDLTNSQANLIDKIATSGPYAATFGIDDAVNWGSGNIDLTDVEVSLEVPGATMVTFSANWKSSGIFALG